MVIRLILLLLLYINIDYSVAGTRDPNIADTKYVSYGAQFYSVVKLCGQYDDGTKFCASAVIIDDHHILTAAHVIDNSKTCTVSLNNKEYCISKIILHEDFHNKEFGTADIALGFCEESFGLESYPELYTNTDEAERKCSLCGYGLTGTFKSGPKYSDNKKRAGQNTIDYIQNNLLICSPSKPGDPDITELEFLICSGDSGGGLFINGKLAGINSCIMSLGKKAPNAIYGDESGHTRISQFIQWIEENKNYDKKK